MGRRSSVGRRGRGRPCKQSSIAVMKTPSKHFFRIIFKSTIQEKKLMLPMKFAREYEQELSDAVKLTVPDGRVWQVGLTKEIDHIWFDDGWQGFVKYYSVSCGNLLLFEYKDFCNFTVLIFDMSTCEIRYPSQDPSSDSQKPVDGKQFPVHIKEEMEDDVSVEILRSRPSTSERASSKIYNFPSQQNLIGPNLGINKCRNSAALAYQKRGKACIMEEADKENDSRRSRLNKNSENGLFKAKQSGDNFSSTEGEGNIITAAKYSRRMSPESKRAMHAAMLSKPKNPSFVAVIAPYNIKSRAPYVPVAFARSYISGASVIKVQVASGREWHIHLTWRDRGHLNFGTGWFKFSRDNYLEDGDVCLFELIKSGKFAMKASIFRASMHVTKLML